MNDNVQKFLGLFLSICFLLTSISLLLLKVDLINNLADEYERKRYDLNVIISDDTHGNKITLEQARSLIGELLLLNFRENSTNQYIYYEGEVISLTKEMKIPLLYIGDSKMPVDFSKEYITLDKKDYELSYEYDDNLEISAYRLK